jgi:hypothetical protein
MMIMMVMMMARGLTAIQQSRDSIVDNCAFLAMLSVIRHHCGTVMGVSCKCFDLHCLQESNQTQSKEIKSNQQAIKRNRRAIKRN